MWAKLIVLQITIAATKPTSSMLLVATESLNAEEDVN